MQIFTCRRGAPASGGRAGETGRIVGVQSTKASRSFWKKSNELFVCWVCGAGGASRRGCSQERLSLSESEGGMLNIYLGKQATCLVI